jgi:heptosyltransferase-3
VTQSLSAQADDEQPMSDPAPARVLRRDRAFRRILVICTRQIGDVLLTTPLIAAAKRRWPEATVDVLGFTGTLGMLRGNPQIGELIEVEAGSGWAGSLALIGRLWRRYDLALISQYSDRAHLYGFVAARRRSGLVTSDRQTSWWKRALLVHAVPVDVEPTHVVLEKLRLLEPWGPPPDTVRVRPPPGAALPDELVARLDARYVVIQVPSAVRYKQWPIARHVALVEGLVGDGVQVVLTGGPSEDDRARTAEVVQGVAPARAVGLLIDAGGTLDLHQLVTLLRGAALYIGPDTSITHLAAALETPLIALYGPIDPRLFGPWPQGHLPIQPYLRRALRQRPLGTPEVEVDLDVAPDLEGRVVYADEGQRPRPLITLLQGDLSCVPCNGMGCDGHVDSRSDCLETMRPQRVLGEARAILGISVPTLPGLLMPVPLLPRRSKKAPA